MERKELLRVWLRGKNYHVLDVKTALEWWEGQTTAGACPTDEDVLRIADDSHREAVKKGIAPLGPGAPARQEIPLAEPERELHPSEARLIEGCNDRTVLTIFGGIMGGSLTIILYEGIRWLLTAYR